MKIVYTEHLISRLKLRGIPKSLPKKAYQEREDEFYDQVEHHRIALCSGKLFGKMRMLVVVFDIVEEAIEMITFYPSDKTEVESKVKTGRWVKNEKS